MDKISILGITFNNLTAREVLSVLDSIISSNKNTSPFVVVTPNPEFVIASRKNSEFGAILNSADMSIPDGIGIVWAGKVLGTPFKERVTGADTVNLLLEVGNKKNYRFFFLGGRGDSAARAAGAVRKNYPNVKVGYYGGEPDLSFDQETRTKIKEFADTQGPIDVLLVAYGQEKQEAWINRNKEYLPVKVVIGVGGVLDYLSGNKKRAPGFIRVVGLEWLFRLVQEPSRIKRQLALPYFVYLVLQEKFKKG